MSDYRDDLAAAQARIAQLEDKLADRDAKEPAPAPAPDPATPDAKDTRGTAEAAKDPAAGLDTLEAARARGEANERAAKLQQDQAQQRDRDYRRAETLAKARRSTSPFAWLATSEWWVGVGSIGVLVVLTGCVVAWNTSDRPPSRSKRGAPTVTQTDWSPFGFGLPPVLLFMAALLGARRSVARSFAEEMRWVEALPFRVEGHLRFMGSGSGRFRVEVRTGQPPQEVAEPIASAVSAPGCTVSLERYESLTYDIRVRGAGSVRAYWVAWRALVRDMILPLHSKYPVAAVVFDDR